MSTTITDAEITGLLEEARAAGDEATLILAHIALGDEDAARTGQRIEAMGGWYAVTRDDLRAMTRQEARARLAGMIAETAAAGE